MRVLVACEMSGRVRDAFTERGHNAISCDIVPSATPGPHYQGDVRDILYDGWDMALYFPPCTHLAVSGARWFHKKRLAQEQALDFVLMLMHAPIHYWCLENPVSIIASHIRPSDQRIQPWQYGHGETKTTCLWLHNLPLLQPTNIVSGRVPRIHHMAPSPDRAMKRSVTYQGIADAMAAQWGVLS